MTDENHQKLEAVQGRIPTLDAIIQKHLPEDTGYGLVIFAPAVDDGGQAYIVAAGSGDVSMRVDSLHAAATALADDADTPPGDPIALVRDLSPETPLHQLTVSAARTIASAAQMAVEHLGLDRHTLLGASDPRAKDLAIGTALVDATAYHWASIIGDDPAKRTEIMRELDKALTTFAGGTPAPERAQ